MDYKLKESDWKEFKNNIDDYKDRYFKYKINKYQNIIDDEDINNSKKYFELKKISE